MRKIMTLLLVLVLVLPGCSSWRQMNEKESSLVALGAVAGGLAGYSFGAGWGHYLYTAGGAAVGGMLGWYVAQKMSRKDVKKADLTAIDALAQAPDQNSLAWINEETGNSGEFVPVNSYRLSDGTSCRDFISQVNVGGKKAETRGTACLAASGEWISTY